MGVIRLNAFILGSVTRLLIIMTKTNQIADKNIRVYDTHIFSRRQIYILSKNNNNIYTFFDLLTLPC